MQHSMSLQAEDPASQPSARNKLGAQQRKQREVQHVGPVGTCSSSSSMCSAKWPRLPSARHSGVEYWKKSVLISERDRQGHITRCGCGGRGARKTMCTL